MKVLIISHQFPSDQVPYSGRFVEDQILATSKCGVEFWVLQVDPSPLRPGNIGGFLRAFWRGVICGDEEPILLRGRQVGVKLFSPGIRFGGGVQAVINALVARRWYRRLRLPFQPDCLHAHTGLSDGVIAYWMASGLGGKPYVITEHTAPYDALFKGFGGRFLAGFAAARASAVIAVSRYLRDCIQTHFPHIKVQVIGNTYDQNTFRRDVDRGPKRTIFWLGHLSARKRLGLAVMALKEMVERGVSVNLRVLTSGNIGADVAKLIEELGLKNEISVARAEGRADVARELASGAAMLVTSEVETFSVATLEALAMGVPVVSTDCGGPADLILDEGDGVLDKVSSPKSLADALIQVMEKDSEEAREARAQRALARFGPEAIGRRYLEVYSEICRS